MATAVKHDNGTSSKQGTYSFTLLLSGFEELSPELENALFEAGCDDALLGIRCGNPYLAFDREAASLEEAIKSAIKDVEAVQAKGIAIEIVKIVPPGEDTIETFNAYLKLRQQLSAEMKNLSADIRKQVEGVLA